MKKPFTADKNLASFYKKTYKNSKFIFFTLAIYDEARLIYENNGTITLITLQKFIGFINKKYGTEFIIITKNNGGK